MSFLKSLFKKDNNQSNNNRQLKSPHDLKTGDIIVLSDSFALPEQLRAQEFQVKATSSYEFEHKVQKEWALASSSGDELYLSLDVDDKTYLKFSLKINHDEVESLFDLDEFATIFDEPGDAFLTRQSDTSSTSNWSSPEYQQSIFAKVGYFHRKDHDEEALSQYEGKEGGEQFELYVLYDQEQSRGIDIEVWQDGDTDVFLTLFRPLTDITDMYPGS
ncbi:hypothetical protein AAD001_07030 [Colwelliaceae bacterium 6471]